MDAAAIVERMRPILLGLAYRMLGTTAEAEDAVHDTFVKWQKADRAGIRNPEAWLTTACTRRCIDLLRAAKRRRATYPGEWLPEPMFIPEDPNEHQTAMLATSLSTAFMLMLERLSPKERAAYVLHDIFELPYAEIAETLGMKEDACRKLVSRARISIGKGRSRAEPPPLARQAALFAAFERAIATGDVSQLALMLADDIEVRHDTGGKVPAALHVLEGKARVLDFVERFLHRVWKKYEWRVVDLNGARAVILRKAGVIVAVVSVGFNESEDACQIQILRNPNKLQTLNSILR